MRHLSLPVLTAFTLLAASASAAKQPNIVWIFSDDHAWQAVSAYSGDLIDTPNIDRIAREGMLFQRCLVPNPICGPSRASVLTGKYSHGNGLYRNGSGDFDGTQWTFPQALQGAGYQTALIGKWHLGEATAPTGFDYSNVLIGQGPYYNPKMLTDTDGDGTREEVQHHGYTTDLLTDMAIDWIGGRKDAEKPFMLMMQHKAPHRPWMPAPRHFDALENVTIPEPPTLFANYDGMPRAARLADMTIAHTMTARDLKLEAMPGLDDEQRAVWDAAYGPRNAAFRAAKLTGDDLTRWKYQRYIKDYLRCVMAVDESVGRVLDYLEANGLAENTMVVYASDQGFYLGENGWFDKRWIYDVSMRTPFLVRWPGHIAPGSECRDLVSVIDVAPTLCEVAGAPIPAGTHGRSMVPLMEGTTPEDWRKSFYFHYYEYPGWHAVRKHYGVVEDRYKLVHFYEEDMREWQLVDTVADPLEQKNFHDDPAYAEIAAGLHAELDRLRAELAIPEVDPPETYPEGDPYR